MEQQKYKLIYLFYILELTNSWQMCVKLRGTFKEREGEKMEACVGNQGHFQISS